MRNFREAETSARRDFGSALAVATALLAAFCLLEWLVLLVRLPVDWSAGVLGLVLRNVLLYAAAGLPVGAALGACLAVLRLAAGSRVGALTRPSGAWSLGLAGMITLYWVNAINVLHPGRARETAVLVLDAAALAAGLVLACVLVRWSARGSGARQILGASAVVVVLLWLPFYSLSAGRGGERIDGGLDLGRVAVERAVMTDTPSPPNVLLVMLDTTRTDCLGCYGSTDGITPNMDALAGESLLFEQAVTPEPLTRPAVTTVLTGLYPRSHGVDTNTKSLDAGFHTLAEALQARGYVTGAFMAASVLSAYYGTDQGFDTYTEPAEGPWELSRFLALKRFYVSVFASSRWSIEITAEEVTRRAVTWIRSNEGRPFFAVVHYFDPHFPYEPPVEHDLAQRHGFTTLPVPYEDQQDMFKPGFDMPDDFLEMTWLKYKGEISYTDECVGSLLNSLDEMGLADDTLLVLMSDHGESFEKGFYFSHGNRLFDSLVHVVLMFRYPGRIGPGRQAQQVHLADLYPTILSLAGVPLDAEVQGTNILGPRGDESPGAPRPVFLQTDFENPKPFSSRVAMGVRFLPWKYVDSPEIGLVELYDLHADPGELLNLAEERPEVAAEMDARLESWLATTKRRETSQAELSPERLEALRALGYVQ
ncbi:MAG: sulfatase [Candidatus Eisenbacteria bacterium]